MDALEASDENSFDSLAYPTLARGAAPPDAVHQRAQDASTRLVGCLRTIRSS